MGQQVIRQRLPILFKAQLQEPEWAVRAVLTVPIRDLAGDLVDPEGLDFSTHARDPWVDLEHGRTEVGRQPVGWARKSLARPGAPYALEWSVLDVPGQGLHRLPVGTTYFDRDDPLQRQVWELVRQDALPGVSLEFIPIEAEELGPSPLEPRPACYFRKAQVLRWSHCAVPVNPAALTVLKSVPPGVAVIQKALRDRTLGGEPLHPYLEKILGPYRGAVAVHLPGAKAMPEESRKTSYEPEEDMPDMPEDESVSDLSGDEPPNNGVAALYAHAQALLDLCDQLTEDLENTDSPELYRQGQALLEEVRQLANKAKELADTHDRKLQALKEGREDDAEEEAASPAEDRDETGLMKGLRPVYRAVLKAVRGRIRRYRLAEVLRGVKVAQNPLDPAVLAEIQKRDPEGYRTQIVPRLQKLTRLQRLLRGN